MRCRHKMFAVAQKCALKVVQLGQQMQKACSATAAEELLQVPNHQCPRAYGCREAAFLRKHSAVIAASALIITMCGTQHG